MHTLRAGVVRVLTLGVDCFFGVRRCKKNKTKQTIKYYVETLNRTYNFIFDISVGVAGVNWRVTSTFVRCVACARSCALGR